MQDARALITAPLVGPPVRVALFDDEGTQLTSAAEPRFRKTFGTNLEMSVTLDVTTAGQPVEARCSDGFKTVHTFTGMKISRVLVGDTATTLCPVVLFEGETE